MQSTTLQDEVLENRESTSSEIETTCDMTMIAQKFWNLEIEYKQKRQRLEQQKSILVTKDMLHTSFTVSSHVAEKSHVPCQYYNSVDQWSTTCPQAEVYPHM